MGGLQEILFIQMAHISYTNYTYRGAFLVSCGIELPNNARIAGGRSFRAAVALSSPFCVADGGVPGGVVVTASPAVPNNIEGKNTYERHSHFGRLVPLKKGPLARRRRTRNLE